MDSAFWDDQPHGAGGHRVDHLGLSALLSPIWLANFRYRTGRVALAIADIREAPADADRELREAGRWLLLVDQAVSFLVIAGAGTLIRPVEQPSPPAGEGIWAPPPSPRGRGPG